MNIARRALIISLVIVSCSIFVNGQTWTQLSAVGSPTTAIGSSLVYDHATNEAILFGGQLSVCCTSYNDVWVLTNADGLGGTPVWSKLSPATPNGAPQPRSFHSAVYDTANNIMIIFGGGQSSSIGYFDPLFNDVWMLTDANGVGGTPTWVPLSPTGGPPAAREGHGAWFDSANNRMIVFGGGNNGRMDVPNDLWVLTNANGMGGTPSWVQLSPSGQLPAAVERFASGFDSVNNRIMIFGGCCSWNNNTWLLTNANGVGSNPAWSQINPSGTPPAIREVHVYGYDPSLNELIFFGDGSGCCLYNDTWSLSSANDLGGAPTWTNLIPNGAPGSPPIESLGGDTAAYDPISARLMFEENQDNGQGGIVVISWVLTLNGTRTSTTTSLVSSLNPSTYGQSITLTAQVSPATGMGTPTGNVTLSESNTVLGVVALSAGVASLPTSALVTGLNPIIASYGGDSNYSPSVSQIVTQQVNQATSASLIVSMPNPSAVNQPVTLTTTVTGQYGGTPTGAITFLEGNSVLGTAQLVNAVGTLSYSFPNSGAFAVNAAYSGDSNYGASTSNQLVQTVETGVQSVGLPVLFVHGFCDGPQSFQLMESDAQAFLQQRYPQLYRDAGQYWVFYDGTHVRFQVPNGIRTYGSVPPTSRFFAVAFDDPGKALVQDFDPLRIAQISIYTKADELSHIIWSIKSQTGAPRVIVVSHSMGGLVLRAYIEELGSGSSPDPYLNDISTLVTLDTPHGGAALARLLESINLGACYAKPSLDSRQMEPSGQDSIIPQLNYFVGGATTLPGALTVYSIQSYWTISTPLGLIDPLDKDTDNVLYAHNPLGFPSEQDLYSNLANPTQNSKSNLFKVNNPFNTLFDLCGSLHVPPYVLHFLSCTGSASQTFGLVEKEIQVPAVMTRAVTITPSSATIALGGSVQMVAKTPSDQAAIWSLLEGPAAGSITQGGLYTTGSVTGTFHVVAIDSVKSNDYGIATITVTP